MSRVLRCLVGLMILVMPFATMSDEQRQPLDVALAAGMGDLIDTDHQKANISSDIQNEMTAPEGGWQRGQVGLFSLGLDREPRWIKASLVNSGQLSREVWIQVARPFVDVVNCSVSKGQRVLAAYRMGDSRAYIDRPIDAQDFLVPIRVEPGDRLDLTCLIQNDGSITANLRSWTPREYLDDEQARRNLRYAGYGAIVLAMVAAGVVAAISRNKLAMLMMADFLPAMLGAAAVDADIFRNVWPDSPQYNWPPYYWIVLGCITESLILLNAVKWTAGERRAVVLPAVLVAMLGLACAVTAPHDIGAAPILAILMTPLVFGVIFPWMCLRHWHEGPVPRVLAIGIGLQVIAAAVNSLGVMGIPWVHGITRHFHLVVLATCLIKVVMMAAALALKIKAERDERRVLHRSYTEELKGQLQVQQQTTTLLLQDARFDRPNQRALEDFIKSQSSAGHAGVSVWLIRLNRLFYLQSAVPFQTMTEVVNRFLDLLEQWLQEREGLQLMQMKPNQSIAVVGADMLAFCSVGKPDRAFVQALEAKLLKRFAWQQMYFAWDPHVGVASITKSEAETDLISKALQALARCTAQHRVQHFDANLTHREQVLHGLTMDIGGAIDRGELELHYQPKVDLESRMTTSFEALVRWRHPERGMIPPAAFIAEAEATGVIHRLTLWAIREALGFVKTLDSDKVRVAVNITAFDIATPGFVHAVADVLARERVSPERLTLEVTESVALEDAGDGAKVLQQLRSMGIQVALDDFGSGHSSLGMLSTLPIDEMKIDRSLVVGVESSNLKKSVLRSAIDLGCRLGKTVTVEGVESAELVDWLSCAGCHVVQGYYFSRPLTSVDASAWFTKFRPKRIEGAWATTRYTSVV
jgi:EAL domain-containing protein (putative c-di-GMP-specific phosphodiesterase class I)